MDRVARSVFVHGSGRSGPAAWPEQLTIPGSRFLVRPGFSEGSEPVRTNFEREAALLNEACGDGAHVVASSFGAIAAIAAAGIKETAVRSLVLIEPAAFSLGRHLTAVEAHIDAVEPVIRAAPTMTGAQFLVALYTAFGITDPQPPVTRAALVAAERMRLQRAPWDAELNSAVFSDIPTLVITGNWNAEYEELAVRLVELGATHRHVEGFRHNPERAPGFNDLLASFWGVENAGDQPDSRAL